MSEAAQQLDQQTITNTQSVSTPPTGTPSASEFRFGDADNVPDWARGKSPFEIVQITEQLRQAVNQNYQQAPQQAPSSSQGLSGQQIQMPKASLIYDNEDEYNRQMAAYQNHLVDQRLSQYAAPILTGQAENSKYLSMNDRKWADTWSRWAPEIELQMRGIPVDQRTKQLWDMAAQLVKSNHMDEIVAERAQQMAANGGFGTERGSGAGGAPPTQFTDPLDELLADTAHPQVMKWKEGGLTKQDIIDYCRQTGRSVKDYVAAIRGEQTFSAGAN